MVSLCAWFDCSDQVLAWPEELQHVALKLLGQLAQTIRELIEHVVVQC